MPTYKEALGFSNRWYPSGFSSAINYDIGEGSIRIFKSPYFIAPKLEAFKGRGANDGRTSTDFEEWVNAHAGYSATPATNYILDKLNEFANS